MSQHTTILFCAGVFFLTTLCGCESEPSYYDPTPDSSYQTTERRSSRPDTFVIALSSEERQALEEGRDANGQYSPYVGRVVGRIHYHANPLFDDGDLRVFVQQNGAAFPSDGAFAGCARALAAVLLKQVAISFDPRDREETYGKALAMGATGEQAQAVADSLASPALDMLRMGQELQWLAYVLPAGAAGNWGPFDTTAGTELRRQYRTMKLIMDPMSDPEVRMIVAAVRGQFEAIAEDDVMWFAVMTGICRATP
jgi:hypothetical protein